MGCEHERYEVTPDFDNGNRTLKCLDCGESVTLTAKQRYEIVMYVEKALRGENDVATPPDWVNNRLITNDIRNSLILKFSAE